MTEVRDSLYYAHLAKAARRLAAGHSDPVVSRHLREAAIRHDRTAKELARSEQSDRTSKRGLPAWLSRLKR